MKRETFIKAIESLEKQKNYDIEMCEKFGKCFPNAFTANLLYDNNIITNSLIETLQEVMNDKDSWIEWFCYETNFGKEYERLKAFDENKQPIKLSNASELYDFLIR